MNKVDWIFCAGMIRSGSTLQYQLTSELVERAGIGHREPYAPESEFAALMERRQSQLIRVFKAHVCTGDLEQAARSGKAAVVYSYRDIRDVAVSAMRKFAFDDIDRLLASGWLQQAIVDYYKWTSMPRVHVSRYESLVSDVPREARAINVFLGNPISETEAATVGELYGFEEQRARVREIVGPGDALKSNNQPIFDSHHLLHHNHLNRGEVGAWRSELNSEERKALHDEFHQWLAEANYPLDE